MICCRAKLRHLLEWSSLYRVTLLLSKINDDSDLDAEAAILYGKVCNAKIVCLRHWKDHGTLSLNITLFYGVAFNLTSIETLICHLGKGVSIVSTKSFKPNQEPITRSLQLPHIPVTVFSQTDLFLV